MNTNNLIETRTTGFSSLFICIEGLDGSGKTTQCKLLKEYLESLDLDVVLTRKPGGGDSKVGKDFRGILKSGVLVNPVSELFVFLADRSEHNVFINSELAKCRVDKVGKVVITDRYYYSTMAYQPARAELKHIPIDTLRYLNNLAINYLEPNILIYLDIPTEDLEKRYQQRTQEQGIEKDHFEDLEFQKQVKANFDLVLDIEKIFFGIKFIKINATQSIEKISETIKESIKHKLP